MKKTTLSLLLGLAIISTSCMGSFAAVNGLKNWNEQLTDNKLVNNILFFGLLPIYGIGMFGDLTVFNPIEYWTGENPITIKEGQIDKKIIRKHGKQYQVTATKNHLEIEVLKGKNRGEKMNLVFDQNDKSWSAIKPNGERTKLSLYKNGFIYIYMPNKKLIKIKADADRSTSVALIKQPIYSQPVGATD